MAGKDKEEGTEEQEQPQTPDGGGKQPVEGQEERTFTQSQLDAIVKDRLTRERGKYKDYEDLKAKAAKLDELEEAQMGELEKAQKRIGDLEAEQELMRGETRGTLIKAAFIAEAARLGVLHPEDAFPLAELSSVDIDEDGRVVGVAEAVKNLVEGGRLPMGKAQAPSLDGGAGGAEGPSEKPLTADELATARKMGLTPEQYQAGKKKKEQ